MRDIRGDLQERVKLLEEQIGATQSQFDKYIEQLTHQHQGKLEELKSDLDGRYIRYGMDRRLHRRTDVELDLAEH